MRKTFILFFIAAALLILPVLTVAQEERLRVVTTTTIIADLARNVGGDLVDVTALVPPDTDAHAFQFAPSDLRSVADADLVIVNGAGLEEFAGSLLENVDPDKVLTAGAGVPVLAFAGHAHEHEADEHEEGEHEEGEHEEGEHEEGEHEEGEHEEGEHEEGEHEEGEHSEAVFLGLLGVDAECDVTGEGEHEVGEHEDEAGEHEDDHAHGTCDPHFWTVPANVMVMVDNIAAAFAAADPANAETYTANAEAYKTQLEALDAELQDLLASVPAENRVLVTNHDFLAYFAHAYDFEIVGTIIPGVSTLAEPDPRSLAALTEVIEETGARAIFAEVSDPASLADVIIGELEAPIEVVTLYSGSLSGPDGPAATYIDYMRYNAQAIAAALGGA